MRGLVPGVSPINAHVFYNLTFQGAIYCVDDDECDPQRWTLNPSRTIEREFEYRQWVTPIPNYVGLVGTILLTGSEALDIGLDIYDSYFLAARFLLDVSPTVACKASRPFR